MVDYTSFVELANEAKSTDLFTKTPYKSWVWNLLGSDAKTMSTATESTFVGVDATPAKFVGRGVRKSYAAYNFGNQELVAKKLAQVSTIPEEDFVDTDIDVVEKIQNLGSEAILRAMDLNLASASSQEFPYDNYSSVETGITAAGSSVDSSGNVVDDALAAMVENESNGFTTNALIVVGGPAALLGKAAGSLNTSPYVVTPEGHTLWGVKVIFVEAGIFDEETTVVALDTTKMKLGIRQDINFKINPNAVITLGTPNESDFEVVAAFERNLVGTITEARIAFAHVLKTGKYPAASARIVS